MRAVWLEVPESFLEERHRLGHDKKDELWEGVLHIVPPPARAHGAVATKIGSVLLTIATRRGHVVDNHLPGLYAADDNYRIPDVLVALPEHESRRGFEGALLVVEVLSPRDESRDKFPFYAKVGVREIWLIDPETRATEIYERVPDAYRALPFVNGAARSPVLDIELRVVNRTLELRDGPDVAVV